MTDYEGERYDGNGGADFGNNVTYGPGGDGDSSPAPRGSSHSHGGADDHSDSKSLV